MSPENLLLTLISAKAFNETRFTSTNYGLKVRSNRRVLEEDLARFDGEFARITATVSPQISLPEFRDDGDDVLNQLKDIGLLSRLSWILAVTATGQEEPNVARASECYKILGAWWATKQLLNLLTDVNDDLDASTAAQEWLHRTTNQEIRYRWAAELICEEIAKHISTHSIASTRIRELTPNAVNELFAATVNYISTGTLSMADDALGLATALSAPAGSHASRGIAELLVTPDMLNTPWVSFPDLGLLPMSPYHAVFMMELSLVALIDRRIGNSVKGAAKGDVYERAAQTSLERATRLPPPTNNLPIFARIDAGNPGEIDLSLGSPVQLIGECKSKYSANHKNAAANFNGEVGEAVEQVRKRLAAATKTGQAVDTTHATVSIAHDLVGIVVVMHSYGGSLLSPRMLNLLSALSPAEPPIAVATLHSWVLLLTALPGLADVRGYLSFRMEVVALNVTVMDELDLFLAYLNDGGRKFLRFARNIGRRSEAAIAMAPYAANSQKALRRAAPMDPKAWAGDLYGDLEPA